MTPFERMGEAFREQAIALADRAPQILTALLLLLAFVGLGRLLARLVDRGLARGRLSATHRTFFRGLVAWAIALVGLALGLSVLGLGGIAAGLITSGGITAIVLGFAFRGIGENLLAGLFLAFSRPFDVGDYISSEGLEGTVRGIALRSTHIRTRDGRDIYIPSAQIFNSPLVNFTKDNLRRLGFTIGVDYRSDLRRAREILAEEIVTIEGVLERPAPVVSVADTAANHVDIAVTFWVDTSASELPGVKGRAIEACVPALGNAGFVFSSEVTTGVVLEGRTDAP